MDSCMICLQRTKHLLLLPCSHPYCNGCLVKWIRSYQAKDAPIFPCQICCQEFVTPTSAAAHLSQRVTQTEVDDLQYMLDSLSVSGGKTGGVGASPGNSSHSVMEVVKEIPPEQTYTFVPLTWVNPYHQIPW